MKTIKDILNLLNILKKIDLSLSWDNEENLPRINGCNINDLEELKKAIHCLIIFQVIRDYEELKEIFGNLRKET